ncbi:MAG: flagellin [Spirochaetes bacterium GWF1_51_8]|nr:MAG: flagellin [Spirochaetes bacterium GWF1_51_8]
MIINHNLSAIFANRSLKNDGLEMDKNIEKLSSGMRINKAGDDASGLAVSEKMRSQVRGLWRAVKNTEDAISFIQTTEGYLQESTDILQRLRELSIQAANGIYDVTDRMMIQVEVSQMIDELDRIASHAQFNGMNMLTGRFAQPVIGNNPTASMWFHLGANMDQRVQAFINTMTASALGMRNPVNNQILSLSTPENANMAIGQIDVALVKVNKQRADLGAYQNRLEYTSKALMIGAENLQAAESRIRDTNMATEMSDFVKNQILTQAATAMLAQANQKPQLVLALLR